MARDDQQNHLRALRAQHRRVLREYQNLKARVGDYSTRRFLSPGEEMERRVLQRAKLFKKDELFGIQTEMDAAGVDEEAS